MSDSKNCYRFYYSLDATAFRQTPDKLELNPVIKLKKLLRNYNTVFRSDDSCELVITHADDNEDLVRNLIQQAQADNPFGAPPQVLIKANLETATVEFSLNLNNNPCDTASLFRTYQSFALQQGILGDYEKSHITDQYDIDYILSSRKVSPGFEGLVSLSSFYPYLKYIKNHPEIRSVLDVGCGAGTFYYLLKQFCQKEQRPLPYYVGLDYGRSQIFRARESFPQTQFFLGTAAQLPFQDNSFDLVVGNSIFGFFSEGLQAMSELFRVSATKKVFTNMCCQVHKHYKPVPHRLETGLFEDQLSYMHFHDFEAMKTLVDSYQTLRLHQTPKMIGYNRGQKKIYDVPPARQNEILPEIQKAISENNLENVTAQLRPNFVYEETDENGELQNYVFLEYAQVRFEPSDAGDEPSREEIQKEMSFLE